MSSWLAQSGDMTTAPLTAAQSLRLIERGTLVIDLMLPLAGAAVLIGYTDDAGWPRAFSVLADPAEGIGVMHRQGTTLLRHMLPGPLTGPDGPARILFTWDAPARSWELVLEQGHGLVRRSAEGANALPIPFGDVAALCAAGAVGQRHHYVSWLGVTEGDAPTCSGGWIGLGTAVATPHGAVIAAKLRPGDLVLTADSGALPLLGVTRNEMPTHGHFGPIRLRSPFFGTAADIIVSPQQQVVLSGAEVEYLFGEDEIAVEARDLLDGRLALQETRRAVVGVVSLCLGRQEVIFANGCALSSGDGVPPGPGHQNRWRELQRYEAMALRSLRRGKANQSAA